MLLRLAKLAALFILVESLCFSQPLPLTAASDLLAKLDPGQTLRYEIEAQTSYSVALMPGYSTKFPSGPCQYAIATTLSLAVGAPAGSGNLMVTAEFSPPTISAWECRRLTRAGLERSLQKFSSQAIAFEVGPHGEVGFDHKSRRQFGYGEAADLLTKLALDLLQARLADRPVTAGTVWKPHGQFTYWQDSLLEGLNLSAATVRWKNTVSLADRNCASVLSTYVFSPTESTSGPVTSGGNLRQEPTNVLAGKQEISLLFDLAAKRIAWLHRFFHVDNHVSVQPEDEPDPEVLVVRWEEEATARLIPDHDALAWLAAVKRFESSPQTGYTAISGTSTARHSVAALARPAHKPPTKESISDLDTTPQGFARWARNFCQSLYCAEVSVALPGQVKIAEDIHLKTTYLAKNDRITNTVSVGPVLPRRFPGLTADEELEKQTDFFLANHLWMSNKPGIQLSSEGTFVDGYPARVTTFRGETRDLADIRGVLAILLSPWGESFPITCSAKQRDGMHAQTTCERIVGLIRLKRRADESPGNFYDP
jgi:hypothetical protein